MGFEPFAKGCKAGATFRAADAVQRERQCRVGVRVGVAGAPDESDSEGNGVRANCTPSKAKRTTASVRTARPFWRAGSKRHCIAAATAAASTSSRTCFVTRASSGSPVSDTRTSRTTSPRTRCCSARSG